MKAINAFTTGCCNVYINRGLLINLNSEAELAGVLGHEIGHITARHPARRQTRGMAASLGAMAAAILTGSNAIGQLANIGAAAWMIGYGRENEMEADRLGMKYMVKAGYNPESIGKVFDDVPGGREIRAPARGGGRSRAAAVSRRLLEPSKPGSARGAGREGRGATSRTRRPRAGSNVATST